jgi:ferredoxin-type protein NapH
MAKVAKRRGRTSQWMMIGFFPLIAIGGLFYPWLGYLMLAMMLFMIPYAYFKGRYWCGNICPRGAFYDIVMPNFTLNRPVPRLLTRRWFRWVVFGFFMSVFTGRMIATGGNLLAIGGVFVSMCIITTAIGLVLTSLTKPRAWCMVCPMGTLQENLGKAGRKAAKKSKQTAQQPLAQLSAKQ